RVPGLDVALVVEHGASHQEPAVVMDAVLPVGGDVVLDGSHVGAGDGIAPEVVAVLVGAVAGVERLLVDVAGGLVPEVAPGGRPVHAHAIRAGGVALPRRARVPQAAGGTLRHAAELRPRD